MTAPLPDDAWGVYVHIPWCRRRCPYCAFYVEADRDVPWRAFVDRVLAEYAGRRAAWGDAPHTLFLGGGTPSRMPPAELERLVAGIAPDAVEITAEANPEDVDDEWLGGALAAGLTRISLGLQTFDPRFARLLNRASSVDQAHQTACRVAGSGIDTWSIDVIFGVPGQSVDDFAVDLEALLAVDPPHVALYGLTFEPGTPFERARELGRLEPVDEETWRAMYETVVERLREAGLRRYEVSNFARPGHESVHNRLYWTDRPYLGLGPSAHSYAPDGTRRINVADVARYLAGDDAADVVEHPTSEQAAVDLLVSGLRGREGLDLARLVDRTGHTVDAAAVDPLVERGLLRRAGSRICLGDEGYPVADAVTRHLAEGLRPAP